MELLRYTISSHPSESVVPLLCLASKFVPDFIKDFFYETKEDDKLFCDLISVHLSSKVGFWNFFLTFQVLLLHRVSKVTAEFPKSDSQLHFFTYLF